MHVKNDFKVSKNLKSTVWDKSSYKWNEFALKIQTTLSLKEMKQGKAKETLV